MVSIPPMKMVMTGGWFMDVYGIVLSTLKNEAIRKSEEKPVMTFQAFHPHGPSAEDGVMTF